MALTHNLGYPRIGEHRELKRVTEAFWKGQVSEAELQRPQQTFAAPIGSNSKMPELISFR